MLHIILIVIVACLLLSFACEVLGMFIKSATDAFDQSKIARDEHYLRQRALRLHQATSPSRAEPSVVEPASSANTQIKDPAFRLAQP